MVNRAQILDALFDHVTSQIPHFKTKEQDVKHWTDTAPQPAFYMRHTADNDKHSWDPLNPNSIEGEFWIFCKVGANSSESMQLRELVGMVRKALAPDDDDRQAFTIGGLVYGCGLNGRSEYDYGVLDGYAKAVMPFTIMLP